jgi:hypothetical protein
VDRAEHEIRLTTPEWMVRIDATTGFPSDYEASDLTITWRDWSLRWGIPWPHDIQIYTRDGVLRARLGRFQIDRALRPGLFEIEPDPDRELLTPREAKARWSGTGAP